MAEEFGITDAIHFAGMQKEPYKYLKKGEICLLTSQNEGFPNALVEGMALGLAPISVNCMTGPAEILLKEGDTCGLENQFAAMKNDKRTPVIYGEYGILLPEMEKERNLDVTVIKEEEVLLSKVIIRLLKEQEILSKYQQAAYKRAQDFTYESYIKHFLHLADK